MPHNVDAVTISNLALSHIGGRSVIESMTENSPGAKQANLWYDFSREQALQSNDWNFARKREALATHTDAPPAEWSFRYMYPADAIAARFIENPAGPTATPIPYTIEMSDDGTTKSILTDLDDAVLIYTMDQQVTALFSQHFILMLSFLLASYMAFSITGKQSVSDSMLQKYELYRLRAPAMDFNEDMQREPREAESIRGRDA